MAHAHQAIQYPRPGEIALMHYHPKSALPASCRRGILLAATALALPLAAPVQAENTPPSLGVGTTAAAIAARIGALLDRQWDHLQWVARSVQEFWPPQNVEELRFILETAHHSAPHIVWIGVATVRDGRVLAAVNGIIEGVDVQQRPWFSIGIERNGAVDVHDAALLQQALRRDPNQGMLRLIDFVSPIRDASGAVVAMIGSHILWDWVVEVVRREEAHARARVALISSSGEILLAPPSVSSDNALQLSSVPIEQRPDTPSFGWRLAMLNGT
jgi:hypothetical protein